MKEIQNNQKIPRSSLLVFLLSLSFVIALLHMAGIKFGLYEHFLGLDSILHFLSGVWVGLAAIWFFFVSEYIKPLEARKWKIFFVAILSVSVIGIFWEYFELLIGVSFYLEKYTADTIKDLILDISGAFLGAVYIIRRYLS